MASCYDYEQASKQASKQATPKQVKQHFIIQSNELETILSISRIQLTLEVVGKTKTTCILKRHLSPRTVGIISRSLPLEGYVHMLGNDIIYIKTSIDSGTERPRSEFKKGDVAFLSSTQSMCFILNDISHTKTMTPLGRLDDVDMLLNVKSGDVIHIYDEAI